MAGDETTKELINCIQCDNKMDLSFRYCPLCGNQNFIDLSRNDFNEDMFLDILNSLYNLIITPNIQGRDIYFFPVSRRIINKRYELEYNAEVKESMAFYSSIFKVQLEKRIEAINLRINSRSSNAITGYAIRTTEELISKRKIEPLSIEEIKDRITSFQIENKEEFIVKYIATHMSEKNDEKRILYIFYLQDDNRHMNYFLTESMLEKYFNTILETNINMTIEKHREALSLIASNANPKEKLIAEEVLNDIVFGYCVKLSESLYPLDYSHY